MRLGSQKINTPRLQTGEQLILESQGAYKNNFRSGWKIVRFFLTDRRFIICQGPALKFDIPLGEIAGLDVEKINYVIKKKEVISLVFKSGKDANERKFWFVVDALDTWKKKLHQAALLKLDMETIKRTAAELDPASQDILWYLWENRHARIDRLAELIDAPSHMHVLLNIKETINPIAEKVVGCPILSFEKAKLDPETGEKILFSWWLMGHTEKGINCQDRLLDIFDEGAHIKVIMEVRGIEASDLKLEVEKNRLTVSPVKAFPTWKELIHLPAEVNPDDYQLHLKNNLLEIKLSRSNSDYGETQLGRE